ncbi:unnamed protein product [Paramecium primaurelia]|uniref:RING-type domain-containing protein n=1 Tax=Paramecium primaurelia TaxID=5886 RepID=A0A8S1M8W8_PARPR|nr:unnamed protein product [Paramecium primaurelia]
MGSFFTSLSSQKPKKEQQKTTLHNKQEQIQPTDTFISMRPTQSIGEHFLQDKEFSFNEEQFKGQSSKMTKGQINENLYQSQEAIMIQQSGKLVRQVNDSKQQNYCYQCKQIIEETLIQIICQHVFHQNCFISIIEKQLQQQGKFIIKCKCGTKLSSNILRQIVDVKIRSKILYQMFSVQISNILQNSEIRKYCNLQEIQQMIEQNTQKEDYDFHYADKKVELKKNITEFLIDQSGILHISQQKLFIISVCLYCGDEISQTLLKFNCGHIYHYECFINWIQFQIQDKKSIIIKCRCGTKMNTNIIRRIQDSKIRLRLLNYLFTEQLSIILPKLNNISEIDQIQELFKQNQYTEDQDYNSSSGFLYFSNYSTPGGD